MSEQLNKDSAPASIDVVQMQLLHAIKEYLARIYGNLEAQAPVSDFRLVTFNITTTGQALFVDHNERLVNDGPADIYVLPKDNVAITAQDAPIVQGDVADLAAQPEGTPYWVKTLTGTATARYLRGGEKSRQDINVTDQNVGVYLQPEWAAKEGTYKCFHAEDVVNFGDFVTITYVVPVGKELRITSGSYAVFPIAAADMTNQVLAYASILSQVYQSLNWNNFEFITDVTGAGAPLMFPTPLVVASGERLKAAVQNRTNCQAGLLINAVGYEVDV